MPHGRSLLVTGIAVLVLVSVGILAAQSLFQALQAGGDGAAGAKPPSRSAQQFDDRDPFAGTPAARYPNGAAGIVLPVATQLGPWTPAQVQDVLARTQQTLVAARLDPVMVEHSNPTRYLSTISEGARATVASSLQTGDALGYVSRLALGYRLAAPIRVKGAMTVTLGPKRELVVGADYVWIYPLEGSLARPTRGGPGSTLVIVHTVETYQWFAPKGIAKKDTGLRPGAGQLATFNMDCDLAKSGKLGLPRTPSGGDAAVPDNKVFDPATRPEGLPTTC